MVNKIWAFLIVSGITVCIINGHADLINKEILSSGKQTLDMVLQLFPVIALWLGIMNIANKSGLLNKLTIVLKPILYKLFPEIPKNHPSLKYISSNIIANVFGLGNVATPFGLKAMKELQELNNNSEVASKSMITFLVLNTSGLTLIPTTIISLRIMHKSISPTMIVLPCIIATFCSTLGGLIMNSILARRCNNK